MICCPSCKTILLKETSSGRVVMHCSRCILNFDGDEDDSLIASNFDARNDVDTRLILDLAAHDRVNSLIKHNCPGCDRRYMTRVVIDNIVSYVCGKCDKILRGDEL